MSDLRATVDRIHRQTTVIVFALAMGVLLFGAVSAWLVSSGAVDLALDVPWVGIAGLVVGVALVGAASPLQAAASRVPPGAAPDAAAQRLLTGAVLGMALREGAGLLGGMLVLLTGQLAAGLALVALSVVTMVLFRPRRDDLERRLRDPRA